MKNSLLTSLSLVAAAMGSPFALSNAFNLYVQESSAGESNAAQNNLTTSNSLVVTAENFVNFVQNPLPTDTLVFKRKLAFYPRDFPTQEQVNQFLADVDAGRISEEELSSPDEFFAVRHLPDRRFIIQSLNHPKDAWNGSVRLREFNGHID